MSGEAMDLGDIEQHFWLTRSVARVMGVNLSEALAEGRLTPEQYCEMVTRCRAGGCQDACQMWLACQTETAQNPPFGCPLGDVLTPLRPV